MSAFVLKRGMSVIKLEKSDNLIAVKPNNAADMANVLAVTPDKMNVEDTQKNIGGFRLISLKSPSSLEEILNTFRESNLIDKGTHVYHTPNSTVPYVPTGQITLRFKPDSTEEERQQVLDDYKLEVLSSKVSSNTGGIPTETYIVGVTPDSPNPLKVAADLQQSPVIQLAEPDLATPGKLTTFTLPADELITNQWHLQNVGVQFGTSLGLKKGADARVIEAWQRTKSLGSPACIVSIIDDGFDLTHPDLSGDSKLTAPWDFKSNTPDPSPRAFNPDPRRGDYHGTACAGVAIGNANGTGIVGAAPNCRFMPVRWGENLSDKSIEDWFGYVSMHGAWVVSCSWGALDPNFSLSTRQYEAIETCAREGRGGLGCVIVFAAGNSNHDINDPTGGTSDGFAIHPDVIAVAASTSRDERATYSNFGKEISVCAPSSGSGGRGIFTTDVRGQFPFGGISYEAGYEAGDFTKSFGGTSSATPLVAGICALMLSVNPSLAAKTVKEILQRTARKIGQATDYESGHSIHFGYGCVNADAAVKAVMSSLTNGPAVASVNAPVISLFQQEWWGPTRHELIGGAADRLLTPKGKAGVNALLADLQQSTLKEIATWADQIKGKINPDKVDKDTKDFIAKYGTLPPKKWHYVDLPLGAERYSREKYPQFTRDNDVVQQLILSIKILIGESTEMSKVNALRWLTHLVGDVHQPLHVGCGYINENHGHPQLETDPDRIRALNLKSDAGGNQLLLPISGKISLHSYWDSIIPDQSPIAANAHVLVNGELVPLDGGNDALTKIRIDSLVNLIYNQPIAADEHITDATALLALPEQWATETLAKAKLAYQTITITAKKAKQFEVAWEGKKQYDQRCASIVSEQLKLASERLALVVNTLFA